MLITKLNYNSTQLAPLEDSPTRERSLVPAEPKPASDLELQDLVRLAQSYNQEAIDELYNRFKGLIINEIKTSYVKTALGEDAENIAWEIFYQTVQSINIEHIRNLASVIKLRLHSRIIDTIRKDHHLSLNITSDNNDTENSFQLTDSKDYFADCISNQYVEHELNKLSMKDKFLFKKIFQEGYSPSEYARITGEDYHKIYMRYSRCLKSLRHKLKPEYLQ